MALSKGLGNKPTKTHARGRAADVEEREEGRLESNAEADDAAPAVAEASPSRVPATTTLGDGGAIREALDDLDCEEDGEAEDAVSPSATAPFAESSKRACIADVTARTDAAPSTSKQAGTPLPGSLECTRNAGAAGDKASVSQSNEVEKLNRQLREHQKEIAALKAARGSTSSQSLTENGCNQTAPSGSTPVVGSKSRQPNPGAGPSNRSLVIPVRGGMLQWHVDDDTGRPFATAVFDIMIRNGFQKGGGGQKTVIKAYHIAYALYLVEFAIIRHRRNGQRIPTDPDLNADDIADYHTKVKAWIVSYIRATPTPDLPEWSDEYQGWVFGPTRTVVISGSGLREVTPVGADPDAAEKKRVERLLRFARVKQESKLPGQQQKSKGKEPVEYEEEVEEALDNDDEY
ncbi:unnamed protein product [Closterium sp. Naga37s-1]|nr:unnamed protein product [Closterium sp. Naga37s-1]